MTTPINVRGSESVPPPHSGLTGIRDTGQALAPWVSCLLLDSDCLPNRCHQGKWRSCGAVVPVSWNNHVRLCQA